MTFRTRLFISLQYIVPQHLLSRCVAWFAETRIPFIKDFFIETFAKKYQVDMQIAEEENLRAYPNFNAFFTRALKSDVRPIDKTENGIACPADGAISQIGHIEKGRIFQAKGQSFSVEELLGGPEHTNPTFDDGKFATVYLSPKDYHRVHMPYAGQLDKMVYVPGDLFSVNTTTAENVPRLFARNERLVCFFSGEQGPFVLVLVGAMIVAGIETVWDGHIAPQKKRISAFDYRKPRNILLSKGEEMGRFKLGSTAILLFPDSVCWRDDLNAASPVLMGQSIGAYQQPS